jgi:hypothetical protein
LNEKEEESSILKPQHDTSYTNIGKIKKTFIAE